MITKISLFTEAIRLPHGYFMVNDTFMLPLQPEGEESASSSVFNKGSIIEINTNQKYIKKWTKFSSPDTPKSKAEWKSTTYPWIDLMGPTAYPEFKKNTTRLEAEEVPDFYKTGKELAKTFTTSYQYVNKKLAEYKLSPSARIKIVILDNE